MPEDPTIWIVLFSVCGLVIILALWLGRGLKLSKNKNGISIEVKENTIPKSSEADISVGRNLEIEESEVGDVTGVIQKDGFVQAESQQTIEVLKGGKLKKAKLGNLTGIRQEEKPQKD